jgi:aspartyl-tRNA(Asn)/glutamyl-tRNA(Gln) amidotransferase subunit A
MKTAPTDLALASAQWLTRLYRAGKASPVEAAGAALARIERHNPRYNAFCLVDAEGALAAARASERRWRKKTPLGPVDGVPTSVKDIVLTKGWPTLRGSKTIDPAQNWADDAPSVARLRESGAVLLGKTTTPELGWKWATDSPLTGVTRNPWNPERTPGGSSGGAAVAASLGMGALHIGTDGGGSIRIPCAWTGIAGIKQTFGRVPAWPLSPFGTLANIGPMARTVGDTALMLRVLSGADWRDWYAPAVPGEDFTKGLNDGVKGLRIAYAPTFKRYPVHPAIAAAVAAAAKTFAALGARVEEAEPDLPDDAAEIFAIHWFGTAHVLVAGVAAEKRALMDPGLLRIAEKGGRYSLADYVRAQMARRELGFRLNRFFRRYDLLLTPQMPQPAVPVLTDAVPADSPRAWVDATPFTYPFNLSRNPAATVPCGFAEGLPAALQLVGRHDEDALVLRAARAFEAVQPFPLPPAATA